MKKRLLPLLAIAFTSVKTVAQRSQQVWQATQKSVRIDSSDKKSKVYYGTASFYADKFNGRQTSNGEIYSHTKLTAACNVLPLNTWVRVTNLRNKRSVILKVNDRLHPRNSRLVDLSKSAAQRLGYIGRGLTQVRVEPLTRRAALLAQKG